MTRILHILSQRPGRSGSGVFLKSMVHEAAKRNYVQHVAAAGPEGTTAKEVPPLAMEQFTPITFPSERAPFPLPGNSDVMPYPSTVFSKMTEEQVTQYLAHTRDVLERVKAEFKPDIVHAHHLWMMTAAVREIFSDTPMVATAHNVGLRLSDKAPHLLPHVLPGIRKVDQVCVLTPTSRQQTIDHYGVAPERITITMAGYRQDYFYPSPHNRTKALADLKAEFGIELPDEPIVTAIGRLSTAKGIPFLLDAVASLKGKSNFRLVLVGATGSGEDGKHNAQLAKDLGSQVIHLGAVPEQAVAAILRCTDLFVLPSLFEGLPLVMLEAVASGCPCLISQLPTIDSWVPQEWLQSGLFRFVPKLQTVNSDVPIPEDTGRYTADLAEGIQHQLSQQFSRERRLAFAEMAKAHSWSAVFERYEAVYQKLLACQPQNV